MKQHLEELLHITLAGLHEGGALGAGVPERIHVERARDRRHGDFASNVALTLAKAAGKKPRDLAGQIVKALPASPLVSRVEMPGRASSTSS